MIMVRGADGKIRVLYNRCPHRGNMMVGDRHGNTGEFFRCSYHAWTFHHDGRLKNIPMMDSGYNGTRLHRGSPECNMKRAARVEVYRGFVFASLAADGRCRATARLTVDDHDHPHSLKPHTWHFMQPSANSSCDPQSGHAPDSISCIPPNTICSPRLPAWPTG